MTSLEHRLTASQIEVISDRQPSRREFLAAALVTLSAVALYVANAALHGALGASRNDDWAYLRVTFRFIETGQFSLDGWTQMSFVGQALLAWPLGRIVGSSIAAMQLLAASMAWVGAMACYLTLRSFTSRAVASLALGLLLIGPVFGALATSFMTDVPSFCFQMLTLLFATRLITNGWSHSCFIAMCSSGVVATSIREYGVVVLVVALAGVGLHLRPQGRQRPVYFAGLAVSMSVVLAMMVWRSGVPNGDPDGVPLTWTLDRTQAMNGLRLAARAALTLALFVAPVAALIVSRSAVRRALAAPWRLLVVVAVWIAVGLLSRLQLVGNYVARGGSYGPPVQGATPPVLSSATDLVVRWIAYLSLLAVMLAVGVDRGSTWPGMQRTTLGRFATLDRVSACRQTVLVSMLALVGVHLFLVLSSNAPFYDRYLIVFVPVLAASVASVFGAPSWSGWSLGMTGLLVVGLGLLGMKFVDASATVDGARWRYASRLVDQGFREETIDAGFEWFNFHQDGTVDRQPGPDRNAWTMFYPSSPVCVTVVAGPEPVGEAVAAAPVLIARSAFGVVYRFNAALGPSAC